MEKELGKIVFQCKGHPNILGTHKNTLELTKDADLSLRGDCVVGIGCNFDPSALREFALQNNEFLMEIESRGIIERLSGNVNKAFSDEHELVLRIGEFESPRTFGLHMDKSAKMLNRDLVESLKDGNSILHVKLFTKQ